MKKILILSGLIGLVFCACQIKDPTGTKIDIPLTIPLLNESFMAYDLVDDTNFFADEDRSVFFLAEGDIIGEPIEVGDLKLDANPNGSGYNPLVYGDFDPVIIEIAQTSEENAVEVVYADILAGYLNFVFTGPHPGVTNIVASFEQIQTKDGERLVVTIPHANFSTGSYNYSLVNHKFSAVPSGTTPTKDDVLKELSIDITLEGTSLIEGNAYGSMKISYDEPIILSAMEGLLINYTIPVEDNIRNISVEYPENIENTIRFTNPQLSVIVDNYLGFESFFVAILTAKNESGTVKEADIADIIEPNIEGNQYLETRFYYDQHAETFINLYPDQLKLTDSNFKISESKIGFVANGESMLGKYALKTPLSFNFEENEFIRPKNITKIEISQKNRDQIKKYTENLSLNVKVKNYYDLDVSVDFFLCSNEDRSILYGDNALPYHDRWLPFTGYTIEKRIGDTPFQKNLPVMNISKEEMPLFYDYEVIYFGVQIWFNDDEGVVKDDWIDVIANLTLTLEFGI